MKDAGLWSLGHCICHPEAAGASRSSGAQMIEVPVESSAVQSGSRVGDDDDDCLGGLDGGSAVRGLVGSGDGLDTVQKDAKRHSKLLNSEHITPNRKLYYEYVANLRSEHR